MDSAFSIFIRSIFIENMIFAYFLGMCSYLAVSKSVKTAFGLGIAVTFVMVITVPLNYLLDKYVLSSGRCNGFQTISYILIFHFCH